jgi:hypothetical protein
VQQAHDDPSIGLVAVGFSPADRLAAIARRLGWAGRVLSDTERRLYLRLDIGQAPWRRLYTPGTLRMYAGALRRGRKINRPEEDIHQLGGDAVMVAGRVTVLWRPRSPDDRPAAKDVLTAARQAGGKQFPTG